MGLGARWAACAGAAGGRARSGAQVHAKERQAGRGEVMRVEVDGQHFDVPDDATPEEIDQISRPAPTDTHTTLQKLAHYGAKALPAAGGVGGALLAGAPAIPTGP